MSWDFPYRLGGPVLAWEMHRGKDRRSIIILGICFFLLCCLHFGSTALQFDSRINSQYYAGERDNQRWQDRIDYVNESKLLFAAQYLGKFFPLQLFVLLLVTPALTASALGQEKEKDTLTALFCTELSDHEIVWGKVLGRYWQLFRFMLFSMPLVFVVAGLARVDLVHILICYLHAFIITFALTGICIFSAVITRRTRDAIMACYSIMIIVVLFSLTLLGEKPIPTWMNPAEVVVGISAYPFTSIKPETLLAHMLFFAIIGWFFVKLSCWTIRWACLRQLEDRSMRWRWGIRMNTIGADPIRWRERHILGIAPLPALRSIPTWLGALGCMAFSISMIGGIVNNITQGRLVYHLIRLQWRELLQLFQRLSLNAIEREVTLMGVILIVFAAITVFLRSMGTINEEKRMKTWDDLLMTAIPVRSIATSKMWGIIQASTLFILCYFVPVFLFALLGGRQAVYPAAVCLVIVWPVVIIAAWLGINFSLASVTNSSTSQTISAVDQRIATQRTQVID
ncbi:MAG: ABC transporter permease subunit [Planctomycetia bacterium]|nr:ABC transporter permease subunit [Planctomycetia bacterium]